MSVTCRTSRDQISPPTFRKFTAAAWVFRVEGSRILRGSVVCWRTVKNLVTLDRTSWKKAENYRGDTDVIFTSVARSIEISGGSRRDTGLLRFWFPFPSRELRNIDFGNFYGNKIIIKREKRRENELSVPWNSILILGSWSRFNDTLVQLCLPLYSRLSSLIRPSFSLEVSYFAILIFW